MFSSLGWIDQPLHLDYDNVVVLKQAYDGNYGHWLMETLPRIGLVEEQVSPESCHVLVMGWVPSMLKVFQDSLRWCGVAESRIIAAPNGPIHLRHAIFPTPISDPPWTFAPYAIRFLERLSSRIQESNPTKAAEAPRRVYLSRNLHGKRKLFNESEVLAILERFGFTLVYPETLSFTEQVLMCCRATHIVSNMGAALTNLVFAPTGVKVLALATEHMPDDFFWDITSQKQGTYVSLHGRSVDPFVDMHSDFTIDPDRLLHALSLIGIEP